MRVVGIGGTCVVIETQGRKVLMSGGVPAAVFTAECGSYRTNATMSRHTLKMIDMVAGGYADMTVPQSVIEALAEGVSPTECVRGDHRGIAEWVG